MAEAVRREATPVDSLWQDIRFGWRLLVRSPGFFALGVAALALGIGANTAVFSVVYHVLLKPLPYPEPERLALIFDTQSDCATCPASYPKYVDWRDENRVFEVIGGSSPARGVLTGLGEPERVMTVRTTASLFRVLAVPPQLGRWFEEEEDRPGGAPVVILSHGFWQRRLGADPAVLGTVLTLDDVPRTVVGVMPPDFRHRRADVWVPLARAVDEATRNNHFLVTYGRLARGVTLEQARREMHSLGERLAQEKDNMGHGIDVQPYHSLVVRDARTPLLVLMGSVVFILLIACANVANLLLARGAGRRREIAVRSALGASKRRLARQLVTESLLLSIAGGVLGLGLAYAGVRAFVAAAPPVLPRMSEVTVDVNVLVFTVLVALAAGTLFGLAPILHARSERQSEALKEEGGRSSGGPFARRAGSVLVVAEIGLSVVLMMGAGLMVKSLSRLQQQDVGVVVERLLAFDVAIPEARYDSDDSVRAFYRNALERVRGIPGVRAAGATNLLPLYQYGSNSYFDVEGKILWAKNEGPLAEVRVVDGDYFEAMGIPLLRGRYLTAQDDEQSPKVIVVNEALAERCWPDEDPIGRHLLSLDEEGDRWRVVGVVGNVRTYSPRLTPEMEVSRSLAQSPRRSMTFVLRTATADPTALVGSLRREMAVVDPSQPLSSIQTMEQVVHESLSRTRLLSFLITGSAGLAALLAVIGVYGLVSFAVNQQRQEFGIRMAMGADRGDVLRLVLGRGLRLALGGVALGALGALALGRLLTSLLYEVTPGDPWVVAGTCGAGLAAAIAACYLPARAATRVDPARTLRAT
jgi:putative ABC transport system permease protein